MPGIMEELTNMKTAEEATLEGHPMYESEVVLTAVRESCGSDEEYEELMLDAATEMALYGVIEDAEVATEASKRIVITDFKAANFNRIEKRAAIRLAKVNEDQLYAKYRKYRDLFLEVREAIYKKYASKAKMETRRILRNSKRNAANMPSANGRTIVDKIDKQIEKTSTDSKKK